MTVEHHDERIAEQIQRKESLGPMYGIEWCRRRKHANANLPSLLMNRELGMRPQGTQFLRAREFYHCMTPKYALNKVEKPNVVVRRFTPNGKQLICFAGPSVIVYDYLGVQNAQHRTSIDAFDAVFKERFSTTVLSNDETATATIARDYCFVTHDSKHLIILKSRLFDDIMASMPFATAYPNNEALTPLSSPVEYTFVSISLQNGQICSEMKVRCERAINVHSIHLVDRNLALLSVHHQLIYMYRVDEVTGVVGDVMQIGRYMYQNDRLHIDNYDRLNTSARSEKFFTGFKQRFLVYLYEKMKSSGEKKHFLRNRHFYDTLKMSKMQMLGSLSQRPPEHGTQLMHFFVILEWQEGIIHGVYGKSSEALFDLFEKYNELFKNGDSAYNYFPSSMEYCYPVRAAHERTKASLISSKNGSIAEARKRILYTLPATLPIYPSVTPYLDPTLFSFDEKFPGIIERAKMMESPLKFFSRKTERLVFELNLESFKGGNVIALFHPTDPFVISFEKNQGDGLLMFHMPQPAVI
ncbi:hypothetical protein QR680_009657 [Steinernema hermaphroditum]|uniref:DET1 homolog n=1 Tax=Steinernema hermaphroditum TaxID=289476 RepID=A0AA39INN2_9BILA|nr:hypothetical protein QR680_009657 [Steinernema hermaphroditum]